LTDPTAALIGDRGLWAEIERSTGA
jgi:hypothetical protein